MDVGPNMISSPHSVEGRSSRTEIRGFLSGWLTEKGNEDSPMSSISLPVPECLAKTPEVGADDRARGA